MRIARKASIVRCGSNPKPDPAPSAASRNNKKRLNALASPLITTTEPRPPVEQEKSFLKKFTDVFVDAAFTAGAITGALFLGTTVSTSLFTRLKRRFKFNFTPRYVHIHCYLQLLLAVEDLATGGNSAVVAVHDYATYLVMIMTFLSFFVVKFSHPQSLTF